MQRLKKIKQAIPRVNSISKPLNYSIKLPLHDLIVDFTETLTHILPLCWIQPG